jgi:hypothetical protein
MLWLGEAAGDSDLAIGFMNSLSSVLLEEKEGEKHPGSNISQLNWYLGSRGNGTGNNIFPWVLLHRRMDDGEIIKNIGGEGK